MKKEEEKRKGGEGGEGGEGKRTGGEEDGE
jgi:hypothetical protein